MPPACTAVLAFVRISSSTVSTLEMDPPALLTKSTAPSDSALIVAFVPSWVRLENMRTGVGQSFMMISNACNPSSTGILTSIVTKSGFKVLTFSTASFPFVAVATTSKSGCFLNISDSTMRMKAESSAIKTRNMICTPIRPFRAFLPVAVFPRPIDHRPRQIMPVGCKAPSHDFP